MAETSGISFWRQDWGWYVQQQSWTKSFYRADQNWGDELSTSRHLDPASAAVQIGQSMGSASIVNQQPVSLAEARINSTPTGAVPLGPTGGGRLDVIA
jgi:hypothetical protein